MKKRIAGLLVAAMVLSLSLGVFAAESFTSADAIAAEEAVTAVTGIEGLTTEAVDVEDLTAAVAEAEEQIANVEEVEVIGAVKVTAAQGGTVTFEVTGLTAADSANNIKILHEKADGTWEVITPDSVADGKVTATFTDFSPVVIVRTTVKAAATGIVTVLPVVAIACVGGIVACAKKENE